jgi:lipoprotein-releasing system ATP-binding protein
MSKTQHPQRTQQPHRSQARSAAGGPHVDFSGGAKPNVSQARVVLNAKSIWKSYHKGKLEIPVLRGVDAQAREGELTAIVGQSGSGKSTLLHLLATLDRPDQGEVHFNGQRIDNLPARQRDVIRNQEIGIIFQFYHLLPELTTLENVMMPILIEQGVFSYWRNRRKAKARAVELLDMVGLSHRLKHRPKELSGGEMQRAAIARALISKPKLLLADEPTGNLDRKNGDEILAILRRLNEQEDLTIVMVTHDLAIAKSADRTVNLVEGRVQAEN